MRRTQRTIVVALWAVAGLLAPSPGGRAVRGQDSFDGSRSERILEFPNLGPIPGSAEPALGPPPGALDADMTTGPPTVIGGRRRTSILPRGTRRRVAAAGALEQELPTPGPKPTEPSAAAVPMFSLDASIADDEGSASGITLDEAIERMMATNLDIRAIRHELPQADADILTAGLRTNPLVYVDTQFIPYGAFNDARPGGPTQYDLNLTLPIDVSQKRKARVVVARMAKSAIEAQFQDLVRRQIAAVGMAFVNLQAARLDLLVANDAVDRCERLLAASQEDASAAGREHVARLTLALERAGLARIEAIESFEDARESLGMLLDAPSAEVARLEPRGGLKDVVPAAPPADDLVRLALEGRPDLLAIRRGVGRAQAEVNLQRANAQDDLYLFYDPITIQDFGPYRRGDASSWAVGLTYSIPIFNRNQGNIARARANVCQTRTELAAAERRAEAEVRLAEREYRTSRKALERIEQGILPLAAAALRRHVEAHARGEIDAESLQDAFDDATTTAQSHRDAVVRHRRSMIELNAAVGVRILP